MGWWDGGTLEESGLCYLDLGSWEGLVVPGEPVVPWGPLDLGSLGWISIAARLGLFSSCRFQPLFQLRFAEVFLIPNKNCCRGLKVLHKSLSVSSAEGRGEGLEHDVPFAFGSSGWSPEPTAPRAQEAASW